MASRRALRVIAAAPLMVLLAGLIYQSVTQLQDRIALSPPGKIFQVNESALHLYCMGSGSPTVILEAGAIGFAQTWAWVQPALAEATRVCSYDRAGLGWSEEADGAHDAVAIARNLNSLLTRSEERGPYLLVGHSLGGTLAQVFTGLYRDKVAGIGLVDPSHPDQLDRFPPGAREQQDQFRMMIGLSAALAPTGLLRATNLLGRLAEGLPPEDYQAARMFASSMQHLWTSYEELSAWDSTMSAARAAGSFGERPIMVISATENMEGMPEGFLEINHAMHRELAAMSSRGRHITVPGSDHYSLIMNRAHAMETAHALLQLLADAR